jgi:hypothetical protein
MAAKEWSAMPIMKFATFMTKIMLFLQQLNWIQEFKIGNESIKDACRSGRKSFIVNIVRFSVTPKNSVEA